MKRLDLGVEQRGDRRPWWAPASLYEWAGKDAWDPQRPRARAALDRLGRVGFLIVAGFRTDRCGLRSSALTFLTVLSLVPSLAFACALLKGLNVYATLREQVITPWLDDLLGAADPTLDSSVAKLRTSLEEIFSFVEATDFARLGVAGLVFLVFAVIKMLGGIEGALNAIWGVARKRSPLRQVADYVSMAVIAPLMLIGVGALTAQAHNTSLVGWMSERALFRPAVEAAFAALPFLSLWAGLSLLYLLLPNARTRISASLLGGAVAAVLWQLLQLGHVNFQIAMAGYNKVYSGFAAFPIFLVWVNLSWVVIMVGAEFAWAYQHEPGLRRVVRVHPDDHGFRQVQAVRMCVRIAARFLHGAKPYTQGELALELELSEPWLAELAESLAERGILQRGEGEAELRTLLPACDPRATSLGDVLLALRGSTRPGEVPALEPVDDELATALEALDTVRSGDPANASLAALVGERAPADEL